MRGEIADNVPGFYNSIEERGRESHGSYSTGFSTRVGFLELNRLSLNSQLHVRFVLYWLPLFF